MKLPGIVRPLDPQGRVVLPAEFRRMINVEIKDEVEIYTEDDCVVLKKFKQRCLICDSEINLVEFKYKLICKGCIENIRTTE